MGSGGYTKAWTPERRAAHAEMMREIAQKRLRAKALGIPWESEREKKPEPRDPWPVWSPRFEDDPRASRDCLAGRLSRPDEVRRSHTGCAALEITGEGSAARWN